jgi:branched-chain amino acid transport system permease protein
VLTFGIALFMRRTLLGIALLAISEDSEAALLRGISVRTLALGTFAFSGLIAGLMGLFIGAQVDAVATLGTSLAVYGFVAIAIGGFGSLTGGLIGGLAVGLIEALAQRYWGGPYGDVAVFGVLLFVLLVRPAGLFGRVSERMV